MECAFMNDFFDSDDRVNKVETLLDQPITQGFGQVVLYLWLLTILVVITYLLPPTLAICGFLYILNIMEEKNNNTTNYFFSFMIVAEQHNNKNQNQKPPAYSRLDDEEEEEDSDNDEDDDDDDDDTTNHHHHHHHLMIQHRSKKDHGDVLNAVHTHRINMKDI